MGKWNRRFGRRSFYEDKPPPPHCFYYTGSCYRGDWRNPRLHWEERFCISVGLPFQKVIVAKRYMEYHENVMTWNDSASQESFYNAKRRFWASINNEIPFDDQSSLDPDIYNSEIDWNPQIDHELISDLEKSYFNPDEPQKDLPTNEKTPPVKSDNPWENNALKETGGLLAGANWGGWDHRVKSTWRTTPDNINNNDNYDYYKGNRSSRWSGNGSWRNEGPVEKRWRDESNWESQNTRVKFRKGDYQKWGQGQFCIGR